jgi:hypothetical protein
MPPTREAKRAAEGADAINLAGTDYLEQLELNRGAQTNSMIGI